MTKLLDRILGAFAAGGEASAGCAPDSWTEYTCTQHTGWSARCKRDCQISQGCVVRCGSEYGCGCSLNPC
ncbi:hypothetical protein Skr01_15340 [Sphaerisporangium krabiense]|uniref:Uncharacterized protein n=1 Tax=Sphaerisporangium krabiense TaxID=763782 RepID=A0A7W8YZW7_9ACTN|nr:hypothetical protein [Sphaerisporangium krabiense]MBB5624598.1 hypothetical protein [Sphaerisporangium krabiense]GII61449.1 hypothetical protein Skr01_15340 [Sphaerisporangium krabiense]